MCVAPLVCSALDVQLLHVFASLSGAIICHAMQCAATKASQAVFGDSSECLREGFGRREEVGWRWILVLVRPVLYTTLGGAMRGAVRWDRFATAAILCHLCEVFWLTSAICGPTPMMTDTLT